MSLLRPLDPNFPIERQLGIETGPVVLVNVFTLDKADEPRFLEVWQDDAAFMKRQPGFISTQLHRALGDSPTYLNYAVWELTAAFRAAFSNPDFQAKNLGLPTLRRRYTASFPEGRGSRRLRRLSTREDGEAGRAQAPASTRSSLVREFAVHRVD